LVAKEYASWDDTPVEGTPGDNPYADGALSAVPLEPNAESIEGYYSHPKFEPMPRAIHQAQVNLPAHLTDPLALFTMFYPQEHVKTFVRSTNEHAKEEMELERREDSSLPDHSRYLNWKPLNIKEVYTFLGILMLMSSNRKPRIENYWRNPRGAGEVPSPFHNYMGLKRFETIHKLFTASLISECRREAHL
jgi:hypothetical protein